MVKKITKTYQSPTSHSQYKSEFEDMLRFLPPEVQHMNAPVYYDTHIVIGEDPEKCKELCSDAREDCRGKCYTSGDGLDCLKACQDTYNSDIAKC